MLNEFAQRFLVILNSFDLANWDFRRGWPTTSVQHHQNHCSAQGFQTNNSFENLAQTMVFAVAE